MKDVRYYTTKRLSGSTTFQCIYCEHSVLTQDFDSLKGNRRTQAAAVMNQHAAGMHLPARRCLAPLKLGNRGAF
jgi:hypothetical protein